MAGLRKCIVCPKHQYSYCHKCGQYNTYETWRYLFCSADCKGIYNICENFLSDDLTALEAQKKLSKLDLSDREDFTDYIKDTLDKIYAVKPKTTTKKKSKKIVNKTE